MNENHIYLKSMRHYNFRHGKENAKVIAFVMYTPENLNPRPCFKVEYESDGFIDYIPHVSLLDGDWQIIY